MLQPPREGNLRVFFLASGLFPASFFPGKRLKRPMPVCPRFQVRQSFTVVAMFRIIKIVLQGYAGHSGAQTAVRITFTQRASSHLARSPEHLSLRCQATGAVRFVFPRASSAIGAAHTNESLIQSPSPLNLPSMPLEGLSTSRPTFKIIRVGECFFKLRNSSCGINSC